MKTFAASILPRSRYPFAMVAGLLLALSFPKAGIAGLAWVAPALIVFAARDTRGWQTFRVGYVAGLVTALTSLYWLLLIPVTGFPILGWVALSAYVALYSAVWLVLVHNPKTKGQSWHERSRWALLGAATWVALEMVRARLFSGFPWNPLGASQYELTPLIQISSVTGVYGVSFLVVWMSLSLYNAATMIVREPSRRLAWQAEIFLPLGVLIALFGFGFQKLKPIPDGSKPTLRVAFIQPSIPQKMIWASGEDSQWFESVLELTRQAATNRPDVILWPEAGTPKMIRYDDEMCQVITNIAGTHGVWMIIGSDDAEPARRPAKPDDADYFNASFLINPAGEIAGRYCKRNLVIFGEYIPLVRWLPFIKWFTPITGGFTPGERVTKFELKRQPPVRTAVLICFEDVFPHLVPEYVDDDTDFLVNLTNNGWFGEGAAQWQHAAAAVFRAVENGVPLLRCSNNGLTCWVDELGRIQQIFRDERGSIYGPGVMLAEIPVLAPGEKRTPTFYRQYGDRFGWACVAIVTLTTLLRLRRRKSLEQSEPS